MTYTTTPAQTWQTYTFRAMGSQMTVWLEADPHLAFAMFDQVERLFAKNEQALSRFLPDSELNMLNGRSGQWTQVSNLLWSVLTEALDWAKVTDGLYDPTMLNALEMAGYTRSFELMTTDEQNGRSPNSPDQPAHSVLGQWAKIQLNHVDEQLVWLPQAIKIDLGGIAKGYTARQAVKLLSRWGACLLNAGGDLTAGDAPSNTPGWPVAIAAPWTKQKPNQESLATLWLVNNSLATSGIDYRRWQQNGRSAHHLIDPRSSQSAQTDVLTATVLAASATEAEVWATTALILGSQLGLDALQQHPGLAGAIITQNEELLLTPAMRRLTTA